MPAAPNTGRRAAGAGPQAPGAGAVRLTSSAHRLFNMIQVCSYTLHRRPLSVGESEGRLGRYANVDYQPSGRVMTLRFVS